jgi:predicted DNA-binding transcriptional regulator YafY
MDRTDLDATRTRLLELYEILKAISVTTGRVSINELKTRLDSQMDLGEYDRRTIYRDLFLLNEITALNTVYDRQLKMYRVELKERLGESELCIIINAILSARFDSESETRAFANLLYRLAGHEKIPGNTYGIDNRIKHGEGKETLQKLDIIRHSIAQNKKISFDYQKFDSKGSYGISYRDCHVSPYKILWQNDRMYLVGNYNGCFFSHYRLERICGVRESNEKRKPVSDIIGYGRQFDEAEYLRQSVGLSSGELAKVEIIFRRESLSEVFDTLGRDVTIIDNGNGAFTLITEVIVNKKLIRWILGFGTEAKVVRPDSLCEKVDAVRRKQGDSSPVSEQKKGKGTAHLY